MNKLLKRCLLGITVSFALGIGAVTLNTNNNYVKADAITGSMHYYVQVTDESDLHVGDTILLFTESGRTFDAAAGNPRFYRMNYVSGVNRDVTKAYVDESQVKRFQLGQGVVDKNSTEISTGVYKNSFSLKLLDHTGFADLRGKYLNHTEDRNAVLPHDRGDVGYYMTPICFKDFANGAVDGHASWEFTYLEYGEVFHITRQDEPNKSTYALGYGGSSARPALDYSWNEGGLRVLKEVPFNSEVLKDDTPIMVSRYPNRLQYYKGENVDLSGLEISIRYKDESIVTASYDNEPSFFKATSVVQYNGLVTVEYCGITFSVNVDADDRVPNTNSYNLINGTLEDYRGTYIAVVYLSEYETYGLKSNLIDVDSVSKNIKGLIEGYDNSGVIKLSTEDSLPELGMPFTIERITISDQSYYFVHVLNGYLTMDNEGNLLAKDKALLTVNDSVTINNNHLIMNGRTLGFDTDFVFGYGYSAQLYRLMPGGDYQTHINNYINTFIEGTAAACSAENVTPNIWNDLSDAFAALTVDEQSYFASLSYTHDFEDIESAENVADRYDYIVAKYKFADFMNRKDAETWKDFYSFEDQSLPVSLSRLLGIEAESSSTYIVVIVSSALVLSLALLFIVRRKHQ